MWYTQCFWEVMHFPYPLHKEGTHIQKNAQL